MSDVVLLLAGGTEPGPELLAVLPADGVRCIEGPVVFEPYAP